MPNRIEEHSDILPRLVPSHGRSKRNRVSDCRIEVANLEVQVHHRTLIFICRGPHGGAVAVGFLENDVDRPFGRGEDGRPRFVVTNGPSKQFRVKRR